MPRPENAPPQDGLLQMPPFIDVVVKKVKDQDVPPAATTVIAGIGKRYLESMINRRRTEAAVPTGAVTIDALGREIAWGNRFILHALGQEAVAQLAEQEIARRYPDDPKEPEALFHSWRPRRPDIMVDAVTPQIGGKATPQYAADEIGHLGKIYGLNLIAYHLSLIDHERDTTKPIDTEAQQQAEGHKYVLDFLGQSPKGAVIDVAEAKSLSQIEQLRGQTVTFS